MKKKFRISEVSNGVELCFTTCFAKNEKSVCKTSAYRKFLMNKLFDSIIIISEVIYYGEVI